MAKALISIALFYIYLFTCNVEAFRRTLWMKDTTNVPKSSLHRHQTDVMDITSIAKASDTYVAIG